MENNQISYVGKRGVHVPKDVKEYVLKRVKESGKSVNEVVQKPCPGYRLHLHKVA